MFLGVQMYKVISPQDTTVCAGTELSLSVDQVKIKKYGS